MKTIEIQNCTEYRDNLFKVFVNGEKHIVRFQSKIQVPDDKPFEIKAKYLGGSSPKYVFEPKDNMLLQVLVNQRMNNRFKILFFSGMILAFVGRILFGGEDFLLISYILLLIIYGLFQIIIGRKRGYIIREVNIENNVK
jgi:hypothetical protein